LRDGGRVDLNLAQAADLELLPGIGPALARRIVANRQTHGAFGSIDELMRVRGIGRRTFGRLQALVEVAVQPQGRAAAPSTPTTEDTSLFEQPNRGSGERNVDRITIERRDQHMRTQVQPQDEIPRK
jgi:competence ComEA-like helix-hairpin-helix protein